jgi:uncharacterized membrane protein YfcA
MEILKELECCAASLGIGLSLGLIGAGGSILTIPVFVYILKKDPVSSSVYSMFVVGLSSMVAGIQSLLDKLIDFKVMVRFGIPSVLGVFIARKLIFPSIPARLFSIGSFVVSRDVLFMLFLSGLMFLSALRILKPANKDQFLPGDEPASILLLLRGLFVGIITGLMGIGGGFLIVPALYFLAKLPIKKAISTGLLVITANSLFSFLSSYGSVNLDWLLLIKFSLGAVVGILIGTKLSRTMPSNNLRDFFGWFILGLSFYIACKQFFL